MNRLPAVFAAVILVAAPLPFGSTHEWSVSAIEVALFVLVGVLVAREGWESLGARFAALCFVAGWLVLYLGFQLLPLPPPVLETLSAGNSSLYRELLGETERWLPLSIDPHTSLRSLSRLAAYAGMFAIVAAAAPADRGNLFYWALLVTGGVTAVVAWIHVAYGWETMLFGRFPAREGAGPMERLSWPFVNPNHLATAMNLCWPLALGAFVAPSVLVSSGSRWTSIATRLVGAALFVLLVATLVGTRSKGGLAAAAAAPMAMALAWPLPRAIAVPAKSAAVALGVSALAAGAFTIALDVIQHPAAGVDTIALARSDATMRIRLIAVAQSLLLLRDFPLFGVGLGTWGEAFPMVQRYPILAVSFPHAHDDYVQWVEETGVFGLALLVALGVVYFVAVLRPLGEQTSRKRAVLLAAVATAAAHAIVEFGVRIPANALMLSAILGLLWRNTGSARSARVDVPSAVPDRLLAAVCGLTVLGLLVYLGCGEWRDARALRRADRGALTPSDSQSWRILERAAWKNPRRGLPDLRFAAAAVSGAPIAASAHRTLAYSFRSIAMRELELRRAIRCAPALQNLRLELAQLLLATGRRQAALAEVERTFYEDPRAAFSDVRRFLDLDAADLEFRAAVHRGLERRSRESPEIAEAARLFEVEGHRATGLPPSSVHR